MDSSDLTADAPPTSINPYEILSVPTSASPATIKSAYKRLALKRHPDKASPASRDAAHTAFQELALAYAVLSDEKRRARYDRTGSTTETLEDDGDFDWADFFRAQYAEHVTADKIRELKGSYQGSEEERADVLRAYERGKGSLDRVFEEVMLSNVLEDEGRIRGYLDAAIEKGEVESFEKYTGESGKKREARRERARKEAEEAEEVADEMGIKDEVFGDGEADGGEEKAKKDGKKAKKAKTAKKKGAKGSEADLAALIQQRHADRAAKSESFFDNLEAKYGGGSKSKKRKADEPSDEAFAAMAKRGKKGKENRLVDEDEEEVEAPKSRSKPLTRKR
ncbi:MAG: hypothetical protein MMC23_006331 [Stictis urceolatum]|nr:hypothetical protein [Stictis urceolata]